MEKPEDRSGLASFSPLCRERLWTNVIVALCGAFLFFLLVTGCVLKMGRDSLCSSVTSVVPNVTRWSNPPKTVFFLNESFKNERFNAAFSFFPLQSCQDAQNRTWSKPLKGERFYSSLLKAEVNTLMDHQRNQPSVFFSRVPSPAQTAVWVNFFFWLIIGVLAVLQRHRSSRSKDGGLAGGLFGDPSGTAEETEPFFNRPARPQ